MQDSSDIPTLNLFDDSKEIRVAIVVNFITSYREDFYRRLLLSTKTSITIYCHKPPSDLNLTSIHTTFASNVRVVPGIFFLGEKIILSKLPWCDFFSKYDVVYIEGNPRYISYALLATILRITGRNIVLWTMVHSFRNSRIGHTLRLTWYRLFNRLLVYSDTEAAYLKFRGFRGQIIGINNGLDFDRILNAITLWPYLSLTEWQVKNRINDRTVILSCARLDKKNKFDQILCILPKLIKKYPSLLWCVIGDGPSRTELQFQANQLGLNSHVLFLGKIYDEHSQAPWFMSSRLLIHPGAVGLTILHGMAFGLPVVTHSDAKRHGPEFAAFVHGKHGLTHREDDLIEMTNCVLELLGDKGRSSEMGLFGQQVVMNQYNTQIMVTRFLSIIDRK
jgi:glycosyltransferase involved in cell wall biosynthesis